MCSKAFTASTFAWLRLVKADGDLTALAVAVQLIEHFNEAEGGVARAGTRYIAEQLGLSHPTVSRALHRLVDRGRLRIEWGEQGRGHANRCWMVVGEGVNKKGTPVNLLVPRKRYKKRFTSVRKKVHQRNRTTVRTIRARRRGRPPDGGRAGSCFARGRHAGRVRTRSRRARTTAPSQA